jgi:hypothetical protein
MEASRREEQLHPSKQPQSTLRSYVAREAGEQRWPQLYADSRFEKGTALLLLHSDRSNRVRRCVRSKACQLTKWKTGSSPRSFTFLKILSGCPFPSWSMPSSGSTLSDPSGGPDYKPFATQLEKHRSFALHACRILDLRQEEWPSG